MKKRIISILAVLVLVLALMPSAFADISANLGSFSAGTEILQPLFENTESIAYDPDLLPQGCELTTISDKVCLTGIPQIAGSYTFSVETENGIYTYYVDIMPYTPNCTISGDKSCTQNENVVVSASAAVKDGGMISYQWYSNTVRSVVGGNPIPGATSSAYTVNTSETGTVYYYCNVTNTNNGISINIYSEVLEVTVTEPNVSRISISKMPNKLKYKVGESVDTTGLALTVEYANGSTGTVTNDYTVTPKTITQDTKGIWVTYKGEETYFAIELEEKIATLVYTMPTKTEYIVGDLLETDGLVLKVMGGANGQEFVTTGFTCNPLRLEAVGVQTINVTYKNTTCSFTVKVSEKGKDVINVVTMPAKTEYKIGDRIDPTGLVLELRSGDKTSAITSGYSIEPQELTAAGTQTITVKYKELTCTFTVNVKEAETVETAPTETPVPVVTVKPSEPSRGPGMNIHRMLVAFIAILAVLALVILGIYVYVARSKNFDESPVGKLFKSLRKYRDNNNE